MGPGRSVRHAGCACIKTPSPQPFGISEEFGSAVVRRNRTAELSGISGWLPGRPGVSRLRGPFGSSGEPLYPMCLHFGYSESEAGSARPSSAMRTLRVQRASEQGSFRWAHPNDRGPPGARVSGPASGIPCLNLPPPCRCGWPPRPQKARPGSQRPPYAPPLRSQAGRAARRG